MKGKLLVLKLFFFVCSLCPAEEAGNIFLNGIGAPASFGKPFWADMNAALIRAEAAYATNSPDYDWGKHDTSYRPYIFSSLGVDIPIWSGNFADGRYGFSLTMPFILDIWYDRYEWVTSPVINVSYRFSVFDAYFISRFDSPLPVFPINEDSLIPEFLSLYIYNWAVKLSPAKHESTHIGDELTIYRMREEFPITRIDVMYNYAEIIFTINDPDGQRRLNHGFRFGALINYNTNKGWYWALETEADTSLVEPARFPFEFHAQYQYQSPVFWRNFQAIASFEYRLRQRFNYPFSYSGEIGSKLENNPVLLNKYENRDLANCFNLYAGLRFDNGQANYFSKIGIGARYYYGINPYGQFRSMPYYSQWGIVFIFE